MNANILPQPPETIRNGKDWYKDSISLNRFVQALYPLISCNQTSRYINERSDTFSSMEDLIQDFPDAKYKVILAFLFGNTPSIFLQLYHELLILASPLRNVFTLRCPISQTEMVTIVSVMSNDVKVQLMTIHLE